MNARRIGRAIATATALAAATATLGLAGLISPGVPAQAATSSGEARFCQAYAVFGDTPSYGNLTAVHAAAAHVDRAMQMDYRRFEADLLAGMPRTILRRDNAALYLDCNPDA